MRTAGSSSGPTCLPGQKPLGLRAQEGAEEVLPSLLEKRLAGAVVRDHVIDRDVAPESGPQHASGQTTSAALSALRITGSRPSAQPANGRSAPSVYREEAFQRIQWGTPTS